LADPRTRREWLKEIGALSAGSLLARPPAMGGRDPNALQGAASHQNGALLRLTSSSDVYIPPRGRSFQKFSFDFPEAAVAFEGLSFAFRVFTGENTYSLDPAGVSVEVSSGGVSLTGERFTFAGGQQQASGRLIARLVIVKPRR
jgi:hypothetical protein